MATAALLGVGVVLTSFVFIAFAAILGGNAIFNGIGSMVISALVFSVTYLLFRYFTRDAWNNGSTKDEIQITFSSYLMMLLVGVAGVWFFGPSTIPDSVHSMIFSFSCIVSGFTASFCAWVIEVAEAPNE